MEFGNGFMLVIGGCFIYLAIAKHYEPLLLAPIGFGILVGNIPAVAGMGISVYDEGAVMRYLYFGVEQGLYPPLIFLGIGAMTDFSTMLSNPKLVLLGAAAQVGVFLTYLGALTPQEAGAIGIIGGADGPTAIFLSARLAPELLGAIAIAAYSYMALVPVFSRQSCDCCDASRRNRLRHRRRGAVVAIGAVRRRSDGRQNFLPLFRFDRTTRQMASKPRVTISDLPCPAHADSPRDHSRSPS